MLLRVLDVCGRNGPTLLCVGVIAGIAVPALAHAAAPLRDVAVFCFTLGAFLRVAPSTMRRDLPRWPLALAFLAWTALGVPLVAWLAVGALRPEPATAHAILLYALAPPLGGAATIAALLGLQAPLALWATVLATIASPYAMPVLGAWCGIDAAAFDPAATALRLALLVGGAAAVATLAHRVAGAGLRASALAVNGFSVLGMVVFALGAMNGVQAFALDAPSAMFAALAGAFALNAGLNLLGTLVFLRAGRSVALTAGLVGGNRSVGIAWVGAGVGLPASAELWLALALLPIYVLPAMTKRVIAALLAPAAAHVPQAVR